MAIGAELLAWTATSLAALSALPQLRRLRDTHDLAGLSAAGPLIGTVNETGWLFYVTVAELWSAMPEPVLMVGSNVAMAVAIRHHGGLHLRPLALAGAWAGTLTVVTTSFGWAALGLLLSIAYAIQMAPCVWSAFRSRRPTGIAPMTWTFYAAEATLWCVYAVVHGDRPILCYGLIGATSAVAILVRRATTVARRQGGQEGLVIVS